MTNQPLTPDIEEISGLTVTPIEAIDAAIKILQEKAEALDVAERMAMLDICPPAARKDVWRRRRYLAYIETLRNIKRGLRNG